MGTLDWLKNAAKTAGNVFFDDLIETEKEKKEKEAKALQMPASVMQSGRDEEGRTAVQGLAPAVSNRATGRTDNIRPYAPSYSDKPKQVKSSFEQWNIEKTQPKLLYPTGMFGYGNTTSDTAFAQRGRRGTRSRQQQEEYKRQAAKNSYNIRRETALKNDRYFEELTDGSDISSDRRAFLENELDLYARDDKDWYWGRSIREAQQKEQDEFNRLSELAKTPEWKMMTPEQQEAEKAKLRGARDEVTQAKQEKDAYDLERAWEENKSLYIDKVKTDPNADLSKIYGNKYRNLSDEEKAKANFIYDYHNKLGKGGALRAISELDKFIQEKADERTVDKNKAEAFRLQQALEAKDMQGNVLPNAREIRQGFIEKGKQSGIIQKYNNGRLAMDYGSLYDMLSEDELAGLYFIAGFYGDEGTAEKYIRKYVSDKENELNKKRAENNGFYRNIAMPFVNVVGNVVAPAAHIVETVGQEYKNLKSGYNDVVPDYSAGSILQEGTDMAQNAFLGDSNGAVRAIKEFGLGLVNTATPMVAGPYAPVVYAAQSAGGGMYETRQKGGSNRQSLAMGTLKGITTYAVSKMGVDNLLNGLKGADTFVKDGVKKQFVKEIGAFLGRQYGSEYAEGYIEAAAGNLFDWMVNRDNSDMAIEIEALMKHKGYTADEAASMVLFNKLVTEPNKQGQLEGLMGIVMGGVNVAFGTGKALYDLKNSPRNTQPFSKGNGKSAYINERLTASDDSDRIKVNNGGVTNGINESRKNIENGDGFSQVSAERTTGGIQEGRIANGDRWRYGYNSPRQRRIETTDAKNVADTERFNKFRQIVGNGVTKQKAYELIKQYKDDARLGDELEISDIIAYDILADEKNDLRSLFTDEIEEYFNQNNSINVDTTGKAIPERVLKETEKSVVRNAKGQLIPLYHATDKEFDRFEIGDIGFHFGSYSQAHRLAESKGILENAKFVKAYLDIKKPLVIEHDNNLWDATHIIKDLANKGIISAEQGVEFIRSHKDSDVLNREVREIIKSKGYDGIIYKNQFESGNADSYIVFDDSQIIRSYDVINSSDSSADDFQFASPVPAETEYERSFALNESLEEYAKRLEGEQFSDEDIERILNQINYGMRYALEGDYSVIQEILPGVSLKAVEKSVLTGDISYIFPKPKSGKKIGNITDVGKNIAKNLPDSLNVTTKSDIIPEKQFVDNPFDENKQLKPNVRYKSGEFDYIGETDDMARVCKVQFSDLKKTTRTKRSRYNNKTPGKLKGDHAGHILGARFGGSSQLDNLVSQASNVNLSEYKKIENIWDRAISAGKTVSGNVNIVYEGSQVRPVAFDVNWIIDNVSYSAHIVN